MILLLKIYLFLLLIVTLWVSMIFGSAGYGRISGTLFVMVIFGYAALVLI